LHLASGDLFREYLELHQVTPANIELVGSLSCGSYQLPYRQYFDIKRTEFAEQHGLDSGRPWIFFPENLGAAFFSERETLRRIRQGMDPQSVREYCDSARRALCELASWCQRAARETDAEIILRPRPATPRTLLTEAVETNLRQKLAPRFHVIKSRSVREWILVSDHTVSNYSTSLVEAAVADKPASILMPYSLPSSMHCDWHEHAARVTSCEQFLELSRHPQAASTSLKIWAEENLLHYGDPIANTARAISDVLNGRCSIPRVAPPDAMRRAKEWLRRQVRRNKTLRRSTAARARPGEIDFFEGDQFVKPDVLMRTAKWKTILSSDSFKTAWEKGTGTCKIATG
jgi:hypothetical protein